ncbi:DUF341 domain-containing protein [Coniochaeta sp. 2T2.1]|nr:DUF341 domain-containing protein [Coniochaeta sp. 2T2.1]
MRILCLHGMGTNTKILAAQTAGIRTALSNTFSATFEFIEGALDWRPAPGITALAGPGAAFFAYYDTEQPSTILQAVDDLAEYVETEGPFDGVLAFSQGAALASMLMARDMFPPPFQFCIFICGGPPFSEKTIKEEHRLRYCDKDIDSHGKPIISVSTIHLVGEQDVDLAECLKLANICREDVREVFRHPGGHEIPSSPLVTQKMVEIIERGIEKALRSP